MADNKWGRAPSPPPPLFVGKPERDFVKQINDEILERVIAQQVLYYPIDIERSNFHDLYGESLNKTFLSPILVKSVLVEFEGQTTETTNYGIDRRSSIMVHFHTRRINEDLDLNVTEGDFIRYGDYFYEIVELNSPRPLFGQIEVFKVEISAKCVRAREGMFDSK